MSSGLPIIGSSGNQLDVDSNSNTKVNLPTTLSQVGGAYVATLNDDGTTTGSRAYGQPYTSDDFRLSVGLDTLLAQHTFLATAQDTSKWKFLSTTMTASQSAGTLLLNASLTATTATGCSMQSWQVFPIQFDGGLFAQFFVQITSTPLTNQVANWGLGVPTATAAPTDGAWFGLTSGGLTGNVLFSGGSLLSTVLLPAVNISDATQYKYAIIVYPDKVEFWRNDILLGTIATAATNSTPFSILSQPLFYQQYNSGTVSGSPQMQVKIGGDIVYQLDINANRPVEDISAIQGSMGYQGQEGSTVTSTALYTNSLAPGAGAAMTNTTAALGSGLGGQFAALPTLTANTDGIVCSYQVPAGTTSLPGRSLLIRGVSVQSMVTTVLVGGPCLWFYSLAFGHTSVSLATAETASFTSGTAKAPRRIALGMESIAAAAAVGVVGSANGITRQFNCPIIVNPGEFVQVVAKNVGTVTTSGVVTFLVTFDACWI